MKRIEKRIFKIKFTTGLLAVFVLLGAFYFAQIVFAQLPPLLRLRLHPAARVLIAASALIRCRAKRRGALGAVRHVPRRQAAPLHRQEAPGINVQRFQDVLRVQILLCA